MPRIAAIRALVAVETRDGFSNRALDAEIRRRGLAGRDAGLTAELVYGVLENRPFLDWVLHQRLRRRPLSRQPSWLRSALRVGAYQLLFLDRIPPHAAISQTVAAVKRRSRPLTGLVNAVLRRIAEEADGLRGELDREVTDAQGLAMRHGLPESLAERLVARFGLEEAISYAAALQARPPVTLRLRRAAERDRAVAELVAEGVEAEPTAFAPAGLRLQSAGRPDLLEAVAQGRALVMDEGSQLVSLFAAPRRGSRVIDLCAGRGGKSFHLADLLEEARAASGERGAGGARAVDDRGARGESGVNDATDEVDTGDERRELGEIIATDVSPARLCVLRRDADRLGYPRIRVVMPMAGAAPSGRGDAGGPTDQARVPFGSLGKADLVLVDAPCTGAGGMRRHPEIRWKLDAARIAGLTTGQDALLEAAVGLVVAGGLLVYAVCSDLPEEGPERVDALLARHPELARERPPDVHGVDWSASGLLTSDGDLATSPHRHGTDGFYAARLRKAPTP
jgi:16S rRNA (cytosine967-C5)-methyltransferase